MFKDQVSGVAERKKIANRLLQQNVLNARFQLVKMVVDKNVLYTRNAVKVEQTQLRTAIFDGEIYFRRMSVQYEDESVQNLMFSEEFASMHSSKKVKVMSSVQENVTWNENNKNREKFFVGFLQLFPDKTATTLESSALVVYPAHAALPNL